MPSDSQFECNNEDCDRDFHEKQAFISHSGRDKALVKTIADIGCTIDVASYLFEFSSEAESMSPHSEDIAEKVVQSDILFVILGEGVSAEYGTQAWIGYEVGVYRGADTASDGTSVEDLYPDRTNKIIAIQDIRQGIKVSVPSLDAILLFDFSADERWEQYKRMAWVMTGLGNLGEFFREGNQFQREFMKANVKCTYRKCKGEYETWIGIQDANKLGKRINLICQNPIIQAECTIECPSCDQMVTRVFTQMLGTDVTSNVVPSNIQDL